MATETTKLTFVEGAAASTPAASRAVIYSKADGLMYSKDDAGAETLMSGGAGGIPATILDVKGDIIAATAADTASRLAAGANGTVLTAASGESTGLQWATPTGAANATYASVVTGETTASASYTDLATAGPAVTVTVPASGRVMLGLNGEISNSATGISIMGVALSGANTVAAVAQLAGIYSSIALATMDAGKVTFLTGLTPGSTTFTAKYKSTAGTGTFASRELWVVPA